LRDARERYTKELGVPVVEVIQPAVRRAVGTSRNKRVGVLGTEATISSRAYEDAFAAAVDFEITSNAAPAFVEFVERGVTSGPELLAAAETYCAPLKSAGVDTLVLGCTHYPLLQAALAYVMGENVNLVSSADETAKDVFSVLTKHDLLAPDNSKPNYRFSATGDTASFEALARRFLGPEVSNVDQLDRGATNG
jgi:glutamate racemase